MTKILDVKLGMVFRPVVVVLVLVYMLVPIVLAIAHMPGETAIGKNINNALFLVLAGCSYASQDFPKFEKVLYPLLFTLAAHLLLVFSSSFLVGSGVSSESLQELSGLLGLMMGVVALWEWFKLLFPEEFKGASTGVRVEKQQEGLPEQT